jgi:hypothetical protein
MNLQRLNTLAPGRSISQQLRMTALLQTREPENRRVNRLPDSQKPMILQEDRLLGSQSYRSHVSTSRFFTNQSNSPFAIFSPSSFANTIPLKLS